MKGMHGSKMMTRTAKNLLLAATLLVAAMVARPASATPLTTPVRAYPDITSSFISVSYLADTKSFQANGFVTTYKPDSFTTQDITNYVFHIGAIINHDGTFSSGLLDMVNYDDSTDHLLTADLAALGFAAGDPNDPTMQFLFKNTRGTLAGDFGPQAFVTLNYSGFETAANGFHSDWDNGSYGDGTSNTTAPAVPEPSTVSLLLLGAGGLLLHRRRRSAKNT